MFICCHLWWIKMHVLHFMTSDLDLWPWELKLMSTGKVVLLYLIILFHYYYRLLLLLSDISLFAYVVIAAMWWGNVIGKFSTCQTRAACSIKFISDAIVLLHFFAHFGLEHTIFHMHFTYNFRFPSLSFSIFKVSKQVVTFVHGARIKVTLQRRWMVSSLLWTFRGKPKWVASLFDRMCSQWRHLETTCEENAYLIGCWHN